MANIISYDITNNQGDTVSIINFGARITRWRTQVGDESRNIILGYNKLEDYLTDPSYIGAIVGPYANRIAKACCKIDDETVTLAANEGQNQLHGGDGALAHQFWQCNQNNGSSLTLTCTLADGFNGYPGDIRIDVTYEISSDSELIISIYAESSKLTIIGPTAHPYFNLNKVLASNIQPKEHNLQIFGNHYTPVNYQCIPTGEIKPVQNTAFDFRHSKEVSSTHNSQQLDHNFLVSLTDTTMDSTCFKLASIESNDKKLTLHSSSNYPAVQVYTGTHLTAPFEANQGICLEPQFSPDSPNQLNFPFHFTSPEQPLNTVIRYKLAK
jgi:aldose 1-epimerase